MENPLIAIVGPTGSGKSSLGVFLAKALAGEILSCDAFQVYRGLNIGTAKLPFEQREGIPHHMMDLVNPTEQFTAGEYMRIGRMALSQITARGHVPIVVGGTGLYLRALLQGLFPGPPRADALRERLLRLTQRRGVPFLHRMLTRIDASSAARIALNDRSRLVRALEVYFVSGRPLSKHFETPPCALIGYRVLKIGINPPRLALYRRINERVDQMFATGLVEEVRRLLEQGIPYDCRGFAAIGYTQTAAYLRNELSDREAIALTQRNSRRYAKRQMTWFRKEKDVLWLTGLGDDIELQREALALIQ